MPVHECTIRIAQFTVNSYDKFIILILDRDLRKLFNCLSRSVCIPIKVDFYLLYQRPAIYFALLENQYAYSMLMLQ